MPTSQTESHHEKEAKLKTSVSELLGPLLRQVELALDSANYSVIQPTISNIYTLLKEVKEHLKGIENLEKLLIGHLGKIEREIDHWNGNKGHKKKFRASANKEGKEDETSLSIIRTKLEIQFRDLSEIFRKLGIKQPDSSKKSHEKASNVHSGRTLHEVGESSNSKNQEKDDGDDDDYDDSIELKQCMNELKPHLRDCLHSLAIFPKFVELKKRLLVYWWIGLGIVASENENKTDEQLGEEYFSELVDKKVLKPVRRKHNREVDRCTINSNIHWQLIDSCEEGTLSIQRVQGYGTWHIYESIIGGSKVKALLNLDINYLNSRDINSKMEATQVQVLQLGGWYLRVICSKKKLIGRWWLRNPKSKSEDNQIGPPKDHIEVDETDFLRETGQSLRYLSLRGISEITKLPASIAKQEDLRILDLRACHNLECLPKKPKILKLLKIFARVLPQPQQSQKWFDNMTHLDISECLLLDSLPQWICELSNLQVLKGFVVGYLGGKKHFCRLSDLAKLKKLRKLSIKIADKHFNLTDISFLEPLDHLLVLTIIWTIYDNRDSSGAPTKKNSVVDEGKKSEVEKQSIENTRKGLSITDSEGEQIKDVNGSKTMRAKKHDIENLLNGSDISRARSKKNGVNNEGKIPYEKKPSKNNIFRPEERLEKNKDTTISLPKNLDKLDIRCYPNDEASFLKSASLQNLKRLYIRGGRLIAIRDDTPWEVEILRLRFLKHFDSDWYKLSSAFPNLKYLEYEGCPRLTNFPRNRSHWKPEQGGHFPSGLFDDDEEVVLSTDLELSKPVSNKSRRVGLEVRRSKSTAPLEGNTHILSLVLTTNDEKLYPDRDGLDLVVVMDISQSMKEKLATTKSSILYFINELSPIDRLSIVTFHTIAKRICGLCQATNSFKAHLTDLINSLEAGGETNTSDGLQMGLKVLKDRRFSRNRDVGILLVSSDADETIRFVAPTNLQLDNVPVAVHTLKFDKYSEWRVSSVLEANTDKSNRGYRNPFKFILQRRSAVRGLTLTITPIKEEATIMEIREASKNAIKPRYIANGSAVVEMGHLYKGRPKTLKLDLLLHRTDKEHSAAVLQISYQYEFKEKWFKEAPVTVYVYRTRSHEVK